MCMIDGGERSEIIRSEHRKARKEHRCGECARTITRGETYHYFRGKTDDFLFDAKTCVQCEAAAVWLQRVCGGHLFEGVLADLEEHWSEGHPYRSMWLARAIVGIRRRWRRFDGEGLMNPLPEPPRAILEPLGVKYASYVR